MVNVTGTKLYAAYVRLFGQVLDESDTPSRDDEILYESSGVLTVWPSEREPSPSPLFVENGCLSGRFDYSLFLDAVSEKRVREHYEHLLLKSGRITSIAQFLRRHPRSKRAVVDVWEQPAGHVSGQDPCLMYLWFRVEGQDLVCHAHFRSNDVVRKLLLNMHILVAIQDHLAKELGVRRGYYRHVADSFHMHTRDEIQIERLRHRFARASVDTSTTARHSIANFDPPHRW